jgi:hypothetical protein
MQKSLLARRITSPNMVIESPMRRHKVGHVLREGVRAVHSLMRFLRYYPNRRELFLGC